VGGVTLGDFNWIGDGNAESRRVSVKVRSMAAAADAWLAPGATTALMFDAPEFGVAPGQAAVLYDGSRVLGGGTIAATAAARSQTPGASID